MRAMLPGDVPQAVSRVWWKFVGHAVNDLLRHLVREATLDLLKSIFGDQLLDETPKMVDHWIDRFIEENVKGYSAGGIPSRLDVTIEELLPDPEIGALKILVKLESACTEDRFRRSKGEDHWATELEVEKALEEAREFIKKEAS